MLGLVRYQPKRNWARLPGIQEFQNEVEKLFDDFFTTASLEPTGERNWTPAVDIIEENDKYLLKAELPGIKEKDIRLNVENNTLTLQGERKEEKEIKEGKCHRTERFYGTFYRAFQLPNNLETDKIKAHYKDGILEVELPKSAESKPKQIEIKVQ